MGDTNIVLRNPFLDLVQDHRYLRDLVAKYQTLEPMQVQERKLQLRKIEEEITTHIWTQDLLVFPALFELQDEQVREDLCRCMAEHRALHMILIDIREAPTSLLFDLAMLRLHLNLERHLADEEKKIYPLALRLTPRTLNRLSRRMDDRERENGAFLEDTSP